MKKHLANLITALRIVGSFLLLSLPVFSFEFNLIYFLCGFSDMIDGSIARLTGSAGAFGAKLDSVADLMFLSVCSTKFMPVIKIPNWMWSWILVVLILKSGCLIYAFLRKPKQILPHTILNKITGFLLFLLPFAQMIIRIEYSGTVVCIMASISALQECFSMVKKTG